MRNYTKYLLVAWLLPAALTATPRAAGAQEVYAAKSADGTKLTFYCDANRYQREETTYGMPYADQGDGDAKRRGGGNYWK